MSESVVDLGPRHWPAGEWDKYMRMQQDERATAGSASGKHGAVSVAYNALAARAGLEALKQGGNAIDALMTTAMTQVALTAGAPISYFGIMSLVYFDAKTATVHTMNAEWNTVLAETDPASIPGKIDFSSQAALKGSAVSGRTAMVGGFMKGVEAAHKRFGKLPFKSLFGPAIAVAEEGMPVNSVLAEQFEFRKDDLARLPETKATFLKPDGSTYRQGEIFRQPAVAKTLKAVAEHGADYMYGGPWGEKLIAAVQADGGKMTLEDLRRYQVTWADPLVAPIGAGYTLKTAPWPNAGGVSIIEAMNLADVSGLATGPHWSKSAKALVTAEQITSQFAAVYLPAQMLGAIYPGMDFSPPARVTREHAVELWARMQKGAALGRFKQKALNHSDDVVVIDAEGNMAAITQSINCVFWGKTAISIDGVSIGDPASFQQGIMATVEPGDRLPAPTETGIVFKDEKPVLAFASMGAGLHHRTFQCLLNVTRYGMSVSEALDAPDFYLPMSDPKTGEQTLTVPTGVFDHKLLEDTGLAYREVENKAARLAGIGEWVGISRDPATGELHAASPNRNNSAAVAF
ncbi:MAG TPA: gamma-glutamyltransferase [Caulobacteraceae bacterium]|jgi:gamma-glutamyltranspeptidase/glutathione hydrolase